MKAAIVPILLLSLCLGEAYADYCTPSFNRSDLDTPKAKSQSHPNDRELITDRIDRLKDERKQLIISGTNESLIKEKNALIDRVKSDLSAFDSSKFNSVFNSKSSLASLSWARGSFGRFSGSLDFSMPEVSGFSFFLSLFSFFCTITPNPTQSKRLTLQKKL